MDSSLELRKVPLGSINGLLQILETAQAWKTLMCHIPKDLHAQRSVPKYGADHVKMLEAASLQQQRPCSELLLEEWSTSGRLGAGRPDLALLLRLLQAAQLYRAADYVAVQLLQGAPVSRPACGPAAVVDVSLTRLLQEESQPVQVTALPSKEFPGNESKDDLMYFSSAEIPAITALLSGSPPPLPAPDPASASLPSLLQSSDDSREEELSLPLVSLLGASSPLPVLPVASSSLPHVPYQQLEEVTDNFDSRSPRCSASSGSLTSGRLGSGGFGSVHLSRGPLLGAARVAVKRLDAGAAQEVQVVLQRQFVSEVELLARYCHPGLLQLLGFSCDGPQRCLVYEYAAGGSLGRALLERPHQLSPSHRLRVATGTAEALLFLHEGAAPLPSLVHRDVKSENILLTEELAPKLADFGLVRPASDSSLTQHVMGTSAYMAPEAFRGDVSVKMDVFSLGVVLLELLTGLQAGGPLELVTRAREEGLSLPLAPHCPWSPAAREALLQLALLCTADKTQRPYIPQVLQHLRSLSDYLPSS